MNTNTDNKMRDGDSTLSPAGVQSQQHKGHKDMEMETYSNYDCLLLQIASYNRQETPLMLTRKQVAAPVCTGGQAGGSETGAARNRYAL
jgi:hypothetical protein